MDALDRALIQRTLTENAELERSGRLLFALAAAMQQVAQQDGHGFGLPTLGPDCTDALIQGMLGQLHQRLQGPREAIGEAVLDGAA